MAQNLGKNKEGTLESKKNLISSNLPSNGPPHWNGGQKKNGKKVHGPKLEACAKKGKKKAGTGGRNQFRTEVGERVWSGWAEPVRTMAEGWIKPE